MLLILWLIRYLEFLLTSTLANKDCSLGVPLVDKVVLGVLVVLFIAAYIYRSWKTRLQYQVVMYLTLFVELLLEITLVVYFVIRLFNKRSSLSFSQLVWHVVWIFHMGLIIFKLVGLLVWFIFYLISGDLAKLTEFITGENKKHDGASDNTSLFSVESQRSKIKSTKSVHVDHVRHDTPDPRQGDPDTQP